jgi:hypothetical protein
VLAAVLGAWLAGALVFFYAEWSTGFNRVFGNVADGRLTVYLNEEWYLVLKGSEPWRSPPFFYPLKGVLGYSDSFVLYQIFFAPFRALGADPFLAQQLTLIALSLVGFSCFVALARATFRTTLFIAIVGALVFTFANNIALHAGSVQIFGIYFVPPIALLALWSWRRRFDRPSLSALGAAAAGGLYALFLFSTYYAAWLALLGAGIVAVFVVLFNPKEAVRSGGAALRTGWRTLLGGVIGAGVGIIPFAQTYLPIVHQFGTRHYALAIRNYAPAVSQLWSPGHQNFLWDDVFHYPYPAPRSIAVGSSYALTPLLSLTMVAGVVVIVFAVLTHRARMTRTLRLTLALCCTAIVLSVLPLETSAGSLWIIVWHLPGASAIRAVGRVGLAADLVAAFALVGLATEAMHHWTRLRQSSGLRAVAVVLLCLIVVEQAQGTLSSKLWRNEQLAILALVRPAPANCRSFYVIAPAPTKMLAGAVQTEAMLISQQLGLPTINGYSGETPPTWKFPNPYKTPYFPMIRTWVQTNHLRDVCALNIVTMRWDAHPGTTAVSPAPPRGRQA